MPYGAGVGQITTSNASTPYLGGIPLGPISAAYSTAESFPGTEGTANRGGGGGGGTVSYTHLTLPTICSV